MFSIDCSPRLSASDHHAFACGAKLWYTQHGRKIWCRELRCSRLCIHVSSTFRSAVSMAAEDCSASDSSHKRDGYDEMQALILSPPYGKKSKSNPASQSPTLLEREALAMEEISSGFSRQERSVAMNELLDLLEQKGIPPGYAFEFVRHAARLLDEMIAAAKEGCLLETNAASTDEIRLDSASQQESLPDEGTSGNNAIYNALSSGSYENSASGRRTGNAGKIRLENIGASTVPAKTPSLRATARNTDEVERSTIASEASFALKVSSFAEQRGIPRLVNYFHLLNMKAFDIPKTLPYVGPRIDTVMAKVEFLRSIGVKAGHLPAVIASFPQLLSYECDQLATVEEFFKGLGFTQKEMGSFAHKHPQILGLDVEKELRSSSEFLEHLGVPPKDLKNLIMRHPPLIIEGADKTLKPIVEYLESIGVKRKHVGILLARRPVLVNSNVEKDLLPVGEYLKNIHASADDIDKIITSFPRLFRYSLDQDFRPTVSHLESLGVDSFLMGKLFRRHPQLLQNRLQFELKTSFLIDLGLDRKDLGKVIYNAPQLLGLSVEEKMQPTTKFLESIGVKGPSLLKVIKRKPMILAHNIDTKLKPNATFLEGLGIEHDSIGKLVTRHPQLLTLSVEKNLDPTVRYLMELNFTREEVAEMVKRLPSLLGFNVVTVLQPKYEYLVDIMNRSPKELVGFTQFFSYSLVNRIIPRHQILGEACKLHSLGSIYGCSDVIFEEKIHKWKMICRQRKEPP